MGDEQPVLLSNLTVDRRQRSVALWAAAALLVMFLIPMRFASIQLPPSTSLIVMVATITFMVDLITASLLYVQFLVLASPALLALASGYLMSSLFMVPYVLLFPGTFSRPGLLGAGLQSAPWLFTFWHSVPPATVIIYVLLRNFRPLTDRSSESLRRAITLSVVAVIAVVCGVTWFVTAEQQLLPPVLSDTIHGTAFWHVSPPFMLSLGGLAFLMLWRRRGSLLDLWLLVQSWSWLLESLLLNFTHGRFDIGFYAARLFWVTSSSFVLLVLISQLAMLNMRVVLSSMAQRRSREERLASLEVFSASVAHELRQPLAAIEWNSDAALSWLERSPPNTAEVRGALGGIASAAQRAAEAIEAVRGIFRKGGVAEMQPVDINEVVGEALAAVENEVEGLRILVEVELAPELPALRAHRAQLAQLVLNLLKNAADAMSPVSDRPRILRIRTQAYNLDGVEVAVSDSGVGIDRDAQERIFDMFYSSKPEGMGMGLPICRSIIDAHGGRLWAESIPGTGSTFRFTLPQNPPSA